MGKKEQKIVEQPVDTTPHLKPEEYWEWRTCIVEMQLEEEKLKTMRYALENKNKETEICKLNAALYSRVLEKQAATIEDVKKEYKKYKEKLEKNLGFSLENKVISDLDFSIKDIDVKS